MLKPSLSTLPTMLVEFSHDVFTDIAQHDEYCKQDMGSRLSIHGGCGFARHLQEFFVLCRTPQAGQVTLELSGISVGLVTGDLCTDGSSGYRLPVRSVKVLDKGQDRGSANADKKVYIISCLDTLEDGHAAGAVAVIIRGHKSRYVFGKGRRAASPLRNIQGSQNPHRMFCLARPTVAR